MEKTEPTFQEVFESAVREKRPLTQEDLTSFWKRHAQLTKGPLKRIRQRRLQALQRAYTHPLVLG